MYVSNAIRFSVEPLSHSHTFISLANQSVPHMPHEKVVVVARVRPLLPAEVCRQLSIATLHDPAQIVVEDRRHFSLDEVYGFTSSTEDVYQGSVRHFVQSFISDRINVTVMAYGQTGTGKTYTMDGMIPLAMQHILDEVPITETYCSYLEVYGETVRDLLARGEANQVSVVDNPNLHCFGVGAVKAKAKTVDEVLWLHKFGQERRTQGETSINATSSRSHAIFSLHWFRDGGETVIHFVDLAGSERQKRTQNVGLRFKESIGINVGLLALGNVIRGLASGSPHIPYRSSKLTRLLQHSLGGNSRTLFLACVAPNKVNVEETTRTLQYSAKAMRIVNEVEPLAKETRERQQRELSPDSPLDMPDVTALHQEIEQLRTALKDAQDKLQKDEVIFSHKFHVLKRLYRENSALKLKVQELERQVVEPKKDVKTTACGSDGTPEYLPEDHRPSPPSNELHAQCNTIALKFEGLHDVVGGINGEATPPPKSPSFLPVSPSKRLDFSSSGDRESNDTSTEEVSALKEHNAILSKRLRAMIDQNEQLTKENATLSRELEEVAMLVSSN